MARILVTGSSGFVGHHLVSRLIGDGHSLNLANRTLVDPATAGHDGHAFSVGDIGPETDWRAALAGCDTVIHLAGQTASTGPGDTVCERVNALGTRKLTEQAADAGVSTFVFLSSVMALVDNWSAAVVTDATASVATSPYGMSKRHAEQHVSAFVRQGRRSVSLRTPMIYGAGAKGNWRRLQQLAASGLPLPFALIANRRTLASVGNVVDAIARVASAAPDAPSGTYLVGDEDAVSLADIVRLLRDGRRRSSRLVSVPPALLQAPLRLAGLNAIANSLFANLELDSSGFRTAFDWSPPQRAADAIRLAGASTSRDAG
jgi:UDP-glucose 4-epimerase